MRKNDFDICLVGGGVTALFLSRRLLRRGFSVALVERNDELAKSPSTRNEGWLHAGSYHAWAIDDPLEAAKVARRCIWGREEIRSHFPDALVEGAQTPSLAILSDHDQRKELESRWIRAGVQHSPVTLSAAKSMAPDFAFPADSAIYEVRERAVNTQQLLDAIVNECQAHERTAPNFFELILGATPMRFLEENVLMVQDNRNLKRTITARIFVYCAGAGIGDLVKQLHGIEIPIRRFKTPLMITRKLGGANIVCLREKELTMMNHRNFSIVGLTRDNIRLGCEGEEQILKKRERLLEATASRFFGSSIEKMSTYCCTKVDFGSNSPYPNLQAQWLEPVEDCFCAIPGKLTEAPFVADMLAAEIWRRLRQSPVAERPADLLLKDEQSGCPFLSGVANQSQTPKLA